MHKDNNLTVCSVLLQVSVRPCDCLNAGSCVADPKLLGGRGHFLCVCAAGFTGPRCEVDVDDCKPNPCRLGRCIDGPDSFSCICPPGMTGGPERLQSPEIEQRSCVKTVRLKKRVE